MDEVMKVMLHDQEGRELGYRVQQLFTVEGSEQMYCCAVAEDGESAVFLKCDLEVNGEDTEMTFSDIPDNEEYNKVAAAYAEQDLEAVEDEDDNLAGSEDVIVLKDKYGNEFTLIVHLVFEDPVNHQEYIAAQEVDAAGNVGNEICLYRIRQVAEDIDTGSAGAEISAIPSDMEYERAREVFLELIEQCAGIT